MTESLFLAQQSGSSLTGFLPILLLVAIFYFMLYRPMRKRQKNHEEMISSLKTGSKVITSGGVHGTVVAVKDNTVMLKVADQVKIEVTKSAISSRQVTD
ncbi:MAG: preprotein translocase subunit YajC [Acidobacteriota bacterium]|nr:preprotein translocase subunit YajC [Acidobacteriota bacterium]